MSDTSRTTSPKREGTSSPRRRREGRRKGPAVTAIDSDTVGGGGAFLSGASPRSSVASAHRGRGRGEATAATSTAASLGAEALEEYDYYYSSNPRSFPHSVKQQCWEKANRVKGRDPERWRRDVLGNLIFRKLVGCPGCLCHDYDHILPYSKGGKSTLENCQVLQATVNRAKGNKTEISKADLIQKSAYCRVSGRDMDLLELSAYGNVRRGQDSGGCSIQ